MQSEALGRGVGVGFVGKAWLGVVGVALAVLPGCQKPAAPAAPPSPTVGVVESRVMDVPIQVVPNGTTRALEQVTIRARVRGFLTERHFEEGATVKKGQLLLVIDEEPYRVALESARSRQAEAQAALRKARESKAREVSAAQVQLDQAQLGLARITERRNAALVARNAGSIEDLDRSEADRRRWESQVEADRANLAQANADYAVGIAAAEAQVSAAKSAVRDAELNLGYCRMVAPIDGRIGEARVKVGNLVGPDAGGGGAFTDLATIQQLDPMGVDLRLSSRDLDRTTELIQGGLEVRLSRPGRTGSIEHPHPGRCYFIDNNVDETTSTFLAKARIPNPGGKLLPGEYVKVRMTVDQLKGAVVVPAPAVVESDTGTIVHVVDKDGKVAVRRVVAGQSFDGLRVIAKGLDGGASVIVDGLQLIRPGLPVKTEPAVLTRRDSEGTKVTSSDQPAPHGS
ncbi:Multidrug resistance protein MexA precursor [Aquisphaera giovannonii]|uniref:Multidrug resistance protein MexA n=1 Tax=Aquisphaera giovannonii TaxID=406548 RepID=A0A5B9WBM9_9BACT|nr:efflux RND transporter periplasmic adaptor subunit [Aquisphaera giovannonii]QEH37421.1 Multidrug resistance protein MexA precursor [Aquisphaera giovannonii]